ncbi:site-specific DNA-methyltransferase [Spirillospora sp. NBC_00431]
MSTEISAGTWREDQLRLNAICPYYTMFPLDFPLHHLAGHPDAKRVLDPFCGRGTTLFAARLTGKPFLGIDLNPVAVAIARAKAVNVRPEGVLRLARRLVTRTSAAEVPRGEFWEWCFHPATLAELVALREALLRHSDSPTANLLRAVMLGILHGPRNKGLPSYLSNQMPRTYASKPAYAVRYWRERGLSPVHVDTLDVIGRRLRHVLAAPPTPVAGRVLLGDAATTLRSLRDRFDLVITSPPYYAMRTYIPDQWLRYWFLGGPPEIEYGTKGQLGRQPSQESFIATLAEVWRATAERCDRGAHLVVRFGALPSSKVDPERMLLASLRQAGVGWAVRDVRPAGAATGPRRQAEQFGRAGRAVDEIDVTAELLSRPARRGPAHRMAITPPN